MDTSKICGLKQVTTDKNDRVLATVVCKEPKKCPICKYCNKHCVGHMQIRESILPKEGK